MSSRKSSRKSPQRRHSSHKKKSPSQKKKKTKRITRNRAMSCPEKSIRHKSDLIARVHLSLGSKSQNVIREIKCRASENIYDLQKKVKLIIKREKLLEDMKEFDQYEYLLSIREKGRAIDEQMTIKDFEFNNTVELYVRKIKKIIVQVRFSLGAKSRNITSKIQCLTSENVYCLQEKVKLIIKRKKLLENMKEFDKYDYLLSIKEKGRILDEQMTIKDLELYLNQEKVKQNTYELYARKKKKKMRKILFKPGNVGMRINDWTVSDILPGGQAEKKGIRSGWKILKIDDIEVERPSGFKNNQFSTNFQTIHEQMVILFEIKEKKKGKA